MASLMAQGAETLANAAEMRVAPAAQPLTDRWRQCPVAPRGKTLLGISLRPRQMETFGLKLEDALATLLAYPFQLVRIGAYWQNCEPVPGAFQPAEIDRQIDAAEHAGKAIILCVGAVKTFGYPEFFVPEPYRRNAFAEGTLITPDKHTFLLEGATAFITRLIERYRDRSAIVAWQVEHEAVDPLGMEHSWRLALAFLAAEIQAVRAADPARPILLNGFLPPAHLAGLSQWWRTRDQGDSLAVAQRLADIVGVDYYPRLALTGRAGRTLYLDGSHTARQIRQRAQLIAQVAQQGRRLMISEGQAEPWETVTTPPNPNGLRMYSCLSEHVIDNYNQWLTLGATADLPLYAYLFWGAEYWLQRQRAGDPSYLHAFARILEES